MLNLDTHILVFALQDTLRPAERGLLEAERWSISGIVLWELAKLHQLGRIALDPGSVEFEAVLNRIHVWPLTLSIARAIAGLDVHVDPADEIVAATSIIHGCPLVTRDRKLLASSLVPLA